MKDQQKRNLNNEEIEKLVEDMLPILNLFELRDKSLYCGNIKKREAIERGIFTPDEVS